MDLPRSVLGIVGGHVYIGDLLLDHADVGGGESALNHVLEHFVFIIIYYRILISLKNISRTRFHPKGPAMTPRCHICPVG